MAHRLFRSLTSIFLAGLALGAPHAAELGEARVGSHIGQQLVADIELTALNNSAAPVQVRLASAEVYRGANIALPPLLSSVNMSVMQREGRQFLHITSLRPVDDDHLHLYLELVDGGQRSVRLSTLWLTPDPNPAPPPPPRAVEPAPALVEPVVPARPPVPVPVRVPVRQMTVKPTPVRMAVPPPPPSAKPAACIPQVSDEAKACIALDAKNTVLREQIGQLEQKVKVLQGAMTRPAVTHAPVKPAVARLLPKKAAEPVKQGWPWWAIAAAVVAVLALAGGGGFVVWRRRVKKAKDQLAARGGIKSRLMPN